MNEQDKKTLNDLRTLKAKQTLTSDESSELMRLSDMETHDALMKAEQPARKDEEKEDRESREMKEMDKKNPADRDGKRRMIIPGADMERK